jgi:EPS-associated MarR family transcriptional regulator
MTERLWDNCIAMLSDEYRYKILKRLEADPEISQRELAGDLGISLGRVNYCIQALIEKGMVKANNFRNSKNKKGYAYLLTPKGIEEKAKITVQFLKIKLAEHEALTKEISGLQAEAQQLQARQPNNVAATVKGMK